MKKNVANMLKKLSVCLLFLSTTQAQAAYQDMCCEPSYQDCCTPSYCCEPCTNFWVDAEYLYWQFKDSPNPVPLVVSTPAYVAFQPLIGEPGTVILLGDKSLDTKWRSGGRFALGTWFGDDQVYGAEVSYLFLSKQKKSQSIFSDGSAGSTILEIPFLNAVTGLESSTALAVPGGFSGLADLKIDNYMQGAELNGLLNWGCVSGFDVKLLAGFRWWQFYETWKFDTSSPTVGDPTSVFSTVDRFKAHNNFYGGQVGICLDYIWNESFFVDVKAKVALGAMREQVDINGHLITNAFSTTGLTQEFAGGYFSQPTNIGKHSKTQFSVIPEVNVNLGYNITENFSIKAGYSFLYVSKMFWSGDQVDRSINISQSPAITSDTSQILVGVPRPGARMKSSDFWAQGVNVGLEYRF